MTLEELVAQKAFALYPCQGAPMVIRVDEIINWMILQGQRTDKLTLAAIVGL